MWDTKGWRGIARKHGFIAKPKKKYGADRDCRRPEKSSRTAETFTVRADTPCHIRREGEKGWRPHVTREALRFDVYAWRNEGWYGFKRQGWEMKVSAEMVRFGRAEKGA